MLQSYHTSNIDLFGAGLGRGPSNPGLGSRWIAVVHIWERSWERSLQPWPRPRGSYTKVTVWPIAALDLTIGMFRQAYLGPSKRIVIVQEAPGQRIAFFPGWDLQRVGTKITRKEKQMLSLRNESSACGPRPSALGNPGPPPRWRDTTQPP